MNSRITRLKDRYFDYSMLRWVAVGVSTTLVDYLIFINIYGPVNSVFIANLFSASVSTSINYYATTGGPLRVIRTIPDQGLNTF